MSYMRVANVVDWWMLPNHEMTEVLIRFLIYPAGPKTIDIDKFMRLYC